MSDLGTVGIKSPLAMRLQGQIFSGQIRAVVFNEHHLFLASGRDDVLGNPTPPSQRQRYPGTFKDIFWPVAAGARTLSIDVLYTGSGLAPRVILKANGGVGLTADLVATASTPGEWETLGPLQFTAIASGVVRVHRERRDPNDGAVNWDNVQVT